LQLSFLAAVICCASCNRSLRYPSITFTETRAGEELLPMLAIVDLKQDKAGALAYVKGRQELYPTTSDSLNLNILEYLKGRYHNSLFKKLAPNVRDHPYNREESAFYKSSFLGFSYGIDTLAVNRLLGDSGLDKDGIVFKWVNYGMVDGQSYFALVGLQPGSKVLSINNADIAKVELERANPGIINQLMELITGKPYYSLTVSLKPSAAAKMNTAFTNDSCVIVRCNFENEALYYSATMQEIKDGMILDDRFPEPLVTLKLKFSS
jgi:hypothetical protein